MNRVEKIDFLIQKLEDLKKDGKNIEINSVQNMEEICSSLIDGKTYAKERVIIDITFDQLYVKDDYNAPSDGYKLYKK